MRLTLPRRLIDSIRCQHGQVVVVAVGVMALGLGAIMISVDAGWWLRDKRDAQNDADATALAAAQELPDRVAAELRGEDWAVANGVDPSTEMAPPDCADDVPHVLQGNFCFIDQNSDGDADKVRVKVSRPSNSFIAGALGVDAPTLNPPAAAATTYVVGACVMPWGIVGGNADPEDHFGLDPVAFYVFQNSGEFDGSTPGNSGAIRIYGQGTYRDTIEGACRISNQGACTGDEMVFVDDTLIGCQSEPGHMAGPTSLGLDARFPDSPSPGACDAATYDEALGRVDDGSSTYCPERLVPVAVIDAFPPGGSGGGGADVRIYGIAHFYIAGWEGGNGRCFTMLDGSEKCGYVWGYLISSEPASTAKVVFTKDFIPFAPTGVALVE